MFYIYILYSDKFDRYYIGQTQDVNARLARHNAGREKSTSPYVPWKLIGFVEKASRAEAVVLESKLKNLNRERLRIFVQKYCIEGEAVSQLRWFFCCILVIISVYLIGNQLDV